MLVLFKMIKKGVFFDLGKCYYSLLYVDDLVQGIILCAESKKAEGKIYFLSDTGVVERGGDSKGDIVCAEREAGAAESTEIRHVVSCVYQ